jgi:hypothetical protein
MEQQKLPRKWEHHQEIADQMWREARAIVEDGMSDQPFALEVLRQLWHAQNSLVFTAPELGDYSVQKWRDGVALARRRRVGAAGTREPTRRGAAQG